MADGLPNTIQVRLVTPERVLLDVEAASVELPAINGYIGVLPGHAPLLSELGAGIVTLQGGNSSGERYFVAWGFVEVLPTRVTMLAETAMKPEEIDTAAANELLREGQEMWQQAGDVASKYEDAEHVIREAESKLAAAGSSGNS
jgi:F-type H+-transporting ATPase subunit epsilon